MSNTQPPGDWPGAPSLASIKADFEGALPAHRRRMEWLRARRASDAPPAAEQRRDAWHEAIAEEFPPGDRVVTLPPPPGAAPGEPGLAELVPGGQFESEAARHGFIDDMAAALLDEGVVALRVTWSAEKGGIVPELLDPASVVVDPCCQGDYRLAGFIVEVFEADLAALRKRGCYRNLERIDLAAAPTLAEHSEFCLSPAEGEPVAAGAPVTDGAPAADGNIEKKKLLVCEYWGWLHCDGSRFAKPVVAAWVGDTLIRFEDNPHPDRLPPFMVLALPPVARPADEGLVGW